MHYKDDHVKVDKMTGSYHTNDNGENFIQGFRRANGRKETNFVVDCRITLLWVPTYIAKKTEEMNRLAQNGGPVMKVCEHGVL
jgi:hypothetical protein